MDILSDELFIKDIIKTLLGSGLIATVLLYLGHSLKKSIEKIKSEEAFKNEIAKIRVEKISGLYDLMGQYGHWLNRLLIHKVKKHNEGIDYLPSDELKQATESSKELALKISFELNKMKFWINHSIYDHTVIHLQVLDEMRREKVESLTEKKIKEYRYALDSFGMNIDSLVAYIRRTPEIHIEKYDRTPLYK